MTHFDFNIPTTFNTVPIGGEFIECLTTCNEIATRIEPAAGRRWANAKRSGGKFIFMADWEPVFVEDYEDGHFYSFFWECPECESPNSISIDDCLICTTLADSTCECANCAESMDCLKWEENGFLCDDCLDRELN